MPPYSLGPDDQVTIPDVLQPWPVAVIRYRWANGDSLANVTPLTRWPTPVHDTAFAYSWLVEALSPEHLKRRSIYVYGSYLGASLAASLALTETHSHAPFGVRGVIAYNGIYNWTMFLPDHRIHQPPRKIKRWSAPPQAAEGSRLAYLQESLPDLFDTPADLFDPFASPSLFFHSPGLLVPKSFSITARDAAQLDALLERRTEAQLAKPPRRSHMVFPPRKSTLRIPSTLLLHDAPNLVSQGTGKKSTRKGNSFATQAHELAGMMQRSIEKMELKTRSQWDDNMDGWEGEGERRVKVIEVGHEFEGLDISGEAQTAIQDWMQAHI